jgi:hypothetical protein
MVDSWPILHPGERGYTSRLGEDLDERQTADGRWPSDHLGYVAVLAVR